MSQRVDMDETDQAILDLLKDDGRLPMREIARRIGVTEGTIRQRLRKLQSANALRFNLVVDPQKIGFDATAYVRIRCDARVASALAKRLTALDEVVFSGVVAGEWNVILFTVVEDRTRIRELVETHVRHAEGVQHVEVCEPVDIAHHRIDIARLIS